MLACSIRKNVKMKKKKKLQWFGNILKMNDGRLPKEVDVDGHKKEKTGKEDQIETGWRE